MKKMQTILLCAVLYASSCAGVRNVEQLIVASELGDCIGVAPQKCFLIKTSEKSDWEFLYSGIEGFNYEPGYEYVLEIKKETVQNPAADQSSVKYILVKEISKTQKISDYLPDRINR